MTKIITTKKRAIAEDAAAEIVTAEVATKAAKAARKAKAKPAAKATRKPKAKAEAAPRVAKILTTVTKAKPLSRRAQIEADAEAGIIPTAPDFSAPTHARFRKKHAEIVALVEAGNVKALRAYTINPISTSPKALARYRDLAVIALTAQGKAAKAAAKGKGEAA